MRFIQGYVKLKPVVLECVRATGSFIWVSFKGTLDEDVKYFESVPDDAIDDDDILARMLKILNMGRKNDTVLQSSLAQI